MKKNKKNFNKLRRSESDRSIMGKCINQNKNLVQDCIFNFYSNHGLFKNTHSIIEY